MAFYHLQPGQLSVSFFYTLDAINQSMQLTQVIIEALLRTNPQCLRPRAHFNADRKLTFELNTFEFEAQTAVGKAFRAKNTVRKIYTPAFV